MYRVKTSPHLRSHVSGWRHARVHRIWWQRAVAVRQHRVKGRRRLEVAGLSRGRGMHLARHARFLACELVAFATQHVFNLQGKAFPRQLVKALAHTTVSRTLAITHAINIFRPMYHFCSVRSSLTRQTPFATTFAAPAGGAQKCAWCAGRRATPASGVWCASTCSYKPETQTRSSPLGGV